MHIYMDIHGKSVDMDMDMDGKFHIHGKPGETCQDCVLVAVASRSSGVAKGGPGGPGPQSSRQNESIHVRINCTKFTNLISLFSG